MIRRILLAVAPLLAAAPAAAQVCEYACAVHFIAAADTVHADVGPAAGVILGAVAGSAAGLYLGFIGGEELGWGGGDDPGLASALLFGSVGSAVGTTLGIQLFSAGRAPVGTTIVLSVAGAVVGLGAAAVAHRATGADAGGLMFSYSVGQGLFAGGIATRLQRR